MKKKIKEILVKIMWFLFLVKMSVSGEMGKCIGPLESYYQPVFPVNTFLWTDKENVLKEKKSSNFVQ